MVEQQKYEEYREKFAKEHGLTIEQATQYQSVKNYKKWLEEEYNVQIKDGAK